MSNEKFTPGKWEVKEYDEIFIVAGQRHIAMMKDNGLYLPWSESQANANLISAAPEMYEALKQIFEICGTVNFSSHAQMRSAIESAVELSEAALAAASPSIHVKKEDNEH